MLDTSKIREHMDVISSDRKTVGQVDHLEGSDKIKLTKKSSPDGQHHHFIPVAWIDHIDQHVRARLVEVDVLIDVIDPRSRDEVMWLAIRCAVCGHIDL